MVEVPISGRVLTWAREFRGLSRAEAAKRLRMAEADLEALEAEERRPSLTTFEGIAAAYRLPLATLFRRTPPSVPDELPDFRTFEGAPPRTSFDFRIALSNVRQLQATLRSLQADDENFHGAALRRYEIARDPFEQGAVERRVIGISAHRQLAWNADDGFRHWRAIIERLGISVYLQNFDLADCRGCALLDDGATPAILINKTERSENAWVYTLIHEYAHLLVRRPGISDLNRRNPTEAWCNRFAAAFLMPVEALRQALPIWPDGRQEWDDRTIREAARRLKVSAQALSIRLEELGKAHNGVSRRFEFRGKPKKAGGKGNYVTTRLSEIGGRFTASVIGALDRDIIDSVHASQALALKPSRLEDARAYVDRQSVLASGG